MILCIVSAYPWQDSLALGVVSHGGIGLKPVAEFITLGSVDRLMAYEACFGQFIHASAWRGFPLEKVHRQAAVRKQPAFRKVFIAPGKCQKVADEHFLLRQYSNPYQARRAEFCQLLLGASSMATISA